MSTSAVRVARLLLRAFGGVRAIAVFVVTAPRGQVRGALFAALRRLQPLPGLALPYVRPAVVPVLVASGAAAAVYLATGVGAAVPGEKTLPVEVRVAGAAVDVEGDLHGQALAIGRAWVSEPLTLVGPDGRRITRSRRWWGGRVDVDELVRLVATAKDPGSVMRRAHARAHGEEALDLPLPLAFDGTRAREVVTEMKDALDRRPRDARIDTATRAPAPHEDGIVVDVFGTIEAVERALDRGASELRVVAQTRPAHRRVEDLANVSTDAVLGTFETRYDASERAADRAFNLRVAASKIDGHVLLPGEVFDFNEVVGERNEANGFRVAPVIAAGELVDGIGGGTCQISGTLHAAVFFAALPVVERRPHSRPSSYIKLGLDAAVSFPSINFRFQNDREHPIAIGFTIEGGIARATIFGPESHQQVSFVRRVDETTPFEERTIDDPELPSGTRVLAQRGIPGFEITKWRIVRDVRTTQAVRERWEDEYPPTTQIWRVGTGGSAPDSFVAPAGDTHPEYTADDYLEVTMGAGIDGTLETRRAGRSGSPGWIARAGYAAPE
jgi:vancomycin resistance protein YoaR